MNDSPSPSTRSLTKYFYPKAKNIAKIICEKLNKKIDLISKSRQINEDFVKFIYLK